MRALFFLTDVDEEDDEDESGVMLAHDTIVPTCSSSLLLVLLLVLVLLLLLIMLVLLAVRFLNDNALSVFVVGSAIIPKAGTSLLPVDDAADVTNSVSTFDSLLDVLQLSDVINDLSMLERTWASVNRCVAFLSLRNEVIVSPSPLVTCSWSTH
jgi:uncharacterized membrane protein YhaH (DUF805 family)